MLEQAWSVIRPQTYEAAILGLNKPVSLGAMVRSVVRVYEVQD